LIFSIISSVLLIIAIVCFLKLTPEQVSDDIISIMTPNDSLRDKARNLRGNKKQHPIYKKLIRMKTALSVTGKSKQFTLVCLLSLLNFVFAAEIKDSVHSTPAPVKDSVASSALNDWHFIPGDAIKISVIPDTGFPNGIYPVDGEGFVDLPMIGPLQVTAMSKTAFEERVNKTYIPLLRFSSVRVRRVISIGFQGGFQKPGVYWISPGATLWYALSMTGGTVREDGIKRMKWERSGKKMDQKLSELLQTPKPISELGFKSGDVIRVINRPQRTGWDIFRQEVLPLLSIGLSTAVTGISIYEWNKNR